MILISGITGRVGASAAQYLLAQGQAVRGLTRDASKAEALSKAGADIVQGESQDADFLRRSMADVTATIIATGNGPDQATIEIGVARAAEAVGVHKIIKISSMEASPSARSPIAKMHYDIEQELSGMDVMTQFLRPNFFMQNLLMFAGAVRASDSFSLPLGDVKTAIVDARDIGEAAARLALAPALAPESQESQPASYLVSGSQLLDFHAVAEAISRVLGRKIRYQTQSHEDFRHALSQAIPSPWHVNAVCILFEEIAAGALAQSGGDLAQLLERAPRTVEDFVEDHRAVFEA